MAENILDKIIKKKEHRINILKKSVPMEYLTEKIQDNKSFINFIDIFSIV